jgi:hypothetical protein
VSFTPRPLYPRERDPFTQWTGGWVGPRAGLETVVKRQIPCPCQDSNPRSNIQPAAQRYTTELSQLLCYLIYGWNSNSISLLVTLTEVSYCLLVLLEIAFHNMPPKISLSTKLRTGKKVKKGKLSLRLTKHHAMKAYWGSGGIDPCILDLGTRLR